MSKSPWGGPPIDYVPLGERVDIPDRPSRMLGYAIVFGALIIGVLLGAVLA